MQDNSEFNIATSSLHALSNIMTRNEKSSPHSSPRLSRRGLDASEIYGQHQQHSITNNNHINVNALKSTTAAASASACKPLTNISAPIISQTVPNRMSAPQMASHSSLAATSILSSAAGGIQDPAAPPLPPRKLSPNVDNSMVNRTLKPQMTSNNSVTNTSSLSNLSINSPISTLSSRSSEDITRCDFEVPKCVAPPVPKNTAIVPHGSMSPPETSSPEFGERVSTIDDTITKDLSNISFHKDDYDKVIVGPAETITGIIDTRPLDIRNRDSTVTPATNVTNNLYQLRTTPQQQTPSTNESSSSASISVRIPPVYDHESATTSSTLSSASMSAKIQSTGGLSLYENVAINATDCNVPYENINLEYISRLMNEGYSKESVIAALGISRNNIEMACDILHEFVSKNST